MVKGRLSHFSIGVVIMASILSRPVDLLIVLCLITFALIALTLDYIHGLYGPILELKEEDMEKFLWPPAPTLNFFVWWCETYDPLMAHNPMWYETMAWFPTFLYTPFYIAAIYAFIYEKEWIRVPALMWSYGILLTFFVIFREALFGKYAAPDRIVFFAVNGACTLVPIILMLRVAWTPVFSGRKLKRE